MTAPGGTLDERVAALAQDLAAAFRGLIDPLTGPNPRPTRVQSLLGIDKTQSWRLVKLMALENPFEAIHESPAPIGLLAIVSSAEKIGGNAEAAGLVRDVIQRFDGMLAEFPDGRTGLNAAVAAHVPKAREALYRDARRKLAQSMAQLPGVRTQTRYAAGILIPSSIDTVSVDAVVLTGYIGFRRLRSGTKPIMFVRQPHDSVPGTGAPEMLTLDGERDEDPMRRYMEEFSTLPASGIRLQPSGGQVRMMLGEHEPGVNEPVTMFFGQRLARVLTRHQIDHRVYDLMNMMVSSSSDAVILDVFIHESLYPDADPPLLTVEHAAFNPQQQRSCFEDDSFRVDDSLVLRPMGTGLDRSSSEEVPGLRRMLESAFARSKADPGEFRLYRATQVYPLPGFSMVTWLPLPKGASASS